MANSAKRVIEESRDQIIHQIGILAQRASVSKVEMARELAKAIQKELDGDDSEDDEAEPVVCRIMFQAEKEFEVSTQDELDELLDQVWNGAEDAGFENFEFASSTSIEDYR